MIEIDARATAAAAAAFVAVLVGPAVIGGWVLAAGLITAILIARSVFRGDESDVTVAVAVGGATIVAALFVGHDAATVVAASVFVGSELASMGRWAQLDRHVPFGRELARTAGSIGLGLAGGAAAFGAGHLRTTPLVANVALVLVVVGAVAGLGAMRNRASVR